MFPSYCNRRVYTWYNKFRMELLAIHFPARFASQGNENKTAQHQKTCVFQCKTMYLSYLCVCVFLRLFICIYVYMCAFVHMFAPLACMSTIMRGFVMEVIRNIFACIFIVQESCRNEVSWCLGYESYCASDRNVQRYCKVMCKLCSSGKYNLIMLSSFILGNQIYTAPKHRKLLIFCDFNNSLGFLNMYHCTI